MRIHGQLRLPPATPLLPTILCASLIVATALFAIPGPLTWDSGTYHLMVRGLYETGSFFIPNGYDELRSPLLAAGQTMVKQDQIVSQYPEFYTFLSLPFYALFGFRGLMVLNAVMFGGICLLIWRMARWFSEHPRAPLAAVAVYAFGTYAIEYTQSSYPHLASTFLTCVAVWLIWGAALEKDDFPARIPTWLRGPEVRCALAALFFGMAIGVRLDSVFSSLALAVPFVTSTALGWRCLLASGIGSLPPLATLAWTNAIKFGDPVPFSYGRAGGGGNTDSLLVYAPIALAFALTLTLLFWYRYRPFRVTRGRILCLAVAALAVLTLSAFGHRLVYGVFQIVVDMRVRLEIPEPALSRSPGGAVVYWGGVKKALLQSCPYLVLIVLPALRGLRGGTYGSRWLLWLVPVGFIGFYGYLAWHGSVGWNMRYLNPALPFLAMLASHELLKVAEQMPTRRPVFWVGTIALWILLVWIVLGARQSLALQEQLLLNGGLALAGLLLTLQLASVAGPARYTPLFRSALGCALVLSLIWSAALTFGADYLNSVTVRLHFLNGARAIAEKIEDHAVIVTDRPDYLWPLLDSSKRPVIANQGRVSSADELAIELVKRSVGHRPVYLLTPAQGSRGSTAVIEHFRSQGVQGETVLEPAAGRPYRLVRLTHGN